MGSRLNSEILDSCAPSHSTSRFCLDHSHCPVLAPATLAALPSTRAIPDRAVFYVARVPAAPFASTAFDIRLSLGRIAPFYTTVSDPSKIVSLITSVRAMRGA